MENTMDYFQLIIGAYLIYAGVTGKGQAYKDETIHASKKAEFKKFMRLFCLIGGPILSLSSILALNRIQPWATILLGVFAVGVVYAGVITYKMADRTINKQGAKQKKSGKK